MVKTYCENPLLISEFNQLPACRNLEISIVDDKSLDVIMRIKKLLSIFEPMGIDELRYVYIEAVRGTIEDWCTYEDYRKITGERMKAWKKEWRYGYPYSKEWYQIGIRHYKELTFLYISRNWREDIILGNTKDIYTPREQVESPIYDVSSFLIKLEAYLVSVVESIKNDPQGYIRYLEGNYPHNLRTGKISTYDWCRITKENGFDLDDETLGIIQNILSSKPESSCIPLTLREYMRIWKIAYTSLDQNQHLKDSSIEEVFRHSSKGGLSDMEAYDWDSESGFRKWEQENSSYHCFDICYARVHLFAQSYNGRYYLELAAHYEGWLHELLRIAIALYKAGVPFVLRDAENILAMYNLKGDVKIIPFYDFSHSYIGRPERHLPSIGHDGVSKSQYNELVSTIKWNEFKDVKLIECL